MHRRIPDRRSLLQDNNLLIYLWNIYLLKAKKPATEEVVLHATIPANLDLQLIRHHGHTSLEP
jgi:hypothetical protein